MSIPQERLTELSAEEKRALLERLLAEEQPESPDSFPLSFAQQRLWFLHQMDPASPAYNIPRAAALSGALDVRALAHSFREIVRRHETLRTAFRLVEAEPVQVVFPRLEITLPEIDLRSLTPEKRDSELGLRIEEESRRPFDLAQAPLFRVILLRTAPDESVLILNLHHSVSDGWSAGVFLQEMTALYQAFSTGLPSPLPELPVQHADFAVSQREWLQGPDFEAMLGGWRDRLRGAPPLLDLPVDRPRPPVRSYRGALEARSLDAGLAQRLKTLSLQRGGTLFMTLLAGFAALLHRYTGQTDLVIGTPIANRNQEETEGLIGFFVNTLVLRNDLAGNPSFLELLARVRETTLTAYAHQDVPFEKLVEELRPERDLGHSPLFQVLFALQNTPGGAGIDIPGLSIRPLEVPVRTSKFDLGLEMVESGGNLHASAEYSTDLFDSGTVRRLLDHLAVLLSGVADEPGRTLSELPLLTAAERQQLLAEWGTESAAADGGACLHHLFEQWARRSPDAVAAVCDGESLTYDELNRRANRLAHRLRALGAGPDVLIALSLERSLDLVAAVLGTLKAGSAYLPIDPLYPPDRIEYLLEDSGARVLVAGDRLPAGIGATLRIRPDEPGGAGDENPGAAVHPDNLAYAIYTSGSTGKPKGVMVSHRNVARLLSATAPWFAFGPEDVWTLFHSYAFDFSVWELWGALACGGRLVVVPYWVSRSPEAFLDLLVEQRVTVLNQTPSAFRQLVRHQERTGWRNAGTALRYVVFGGEALDFPGLRPWFERYGDQRPRLVNMYGITETTVHVTYRPLEKEDAAAGAASLIGRTLPDLRLRILDAAGEPVPIGVPGELYVGGAGLARGYLGRPELTAQRFVPDPYAGTQGERLYRTGDLARFRPDGDVEYLDRIDHQVKIRSFRIELGEIEAILTGHPAVAEAVVIAWADESGEKRLVAYVVPRGQAPGPEELRSSLKAKLPDHMVPAFFVLLESLPLTPHGKVDRRALPAPGPDRPSLEQVYTAPRTPAEEALSRAWARALGIDRVGIDDNFFSLGGDSMRSVRLLALAREEGLEISLEQLFKHQTIRGLAGEVMPGTSLGPAARPAPFSLLAEEDRSSLPPGLEDAYPLARLQAGMLFHGEMSPEAALYHNVTSFHLRAPFDADAFRAAVHALVARHPILRTSFEPYAHSEILQLVHLEAAASVGIEDLRHLDAGGQEQVLARWFEDEKGRRFDWACPPLLRFQIHRRSDDSFELSVSEHHAILDGWSVASMLTELFQHYLYLLGRSDAPPPPPPASSFRDFVALEREALADEATRRYWSGTLSGAQASLLPRGAGPAADRRVSYTFVPLAPEIHGGLEALSRRAGLPLKSLLLAAHLRVLSLLTGSHDVVTGLVSNGRPEEAEADRVLGLFLNTLPFRVILPEGSWLDLARAVFAAERSLLPHRRFPLADLQRTLGGGRLYEAVFNYVHFHVYEGVSGVPGVEVLGTRSFQATDVPLLASFHREPSSSQVRLTLEYDSSFEAVQVETFAGYYGRALAALATEPSAPHGEAALLADAERRQILEWSHGPLSPAGPAAACLHQLVEEQAARTPDAVAVVSASRRLTYRELDRRASGLARRLRALGVGPEVPVGLAVHRTEGMVAGMLAILKAGGAYVPLDPAYPADRLSWMLEDSRAPIVVTEQDLLHRLPAGGARTVLLDEKEDGAAVEAGATGASLAYVIYTSGSTGRPKGVGICHASAAALVRWALAAFSPRELEGVLAATSICFDLSVFEIFVPLAAGGKVIVAAHALDLPNVSQTGEVTLLNTVPSAAAALVHENALPASIRTVNLAGEPLKSSLVAEILERFPVERVLNLYGPTEDTTYSTWAQVTRGETRWQPPIGQAIAGTQAYVLDSRLRLVPIGVPGELYLGGEGLARGYLGRPDQTAERFVPEPFGTPGGRLYHTGDRARWRPDGALDFLGRIDHQVKIRGFRIEPGEIEAALAAHDGVREAVVVAKAGEAGHRLVTYVVPEPGQHPSPAELRDFLLARLPEHMVPVGWKLLDALPLTPNGKVDRAALPEPEAVGEAAGFVPPHDWVEEKLAALWAEILRVDRVGVHDNFFALGGDSILSIQITARARRAGITITPRLVFQYPTVAELAQAAETGAAPPPDQGTVSGPVSLSPIQHWFFAGESPAPHHYNQAILLQAPPGAATFLARALWRIEEHHDALRLRFVHGSAGWEQTAAALPRPGSFAAVDLSALPASVHRPAIEAAAAQAQASLDLTDGPLHRVLWFDLGAERAGRLFWTIHHLAVDGVSWRILLEDLAEAAAQAERSEPIALPAKTTSFKRWSDLLATYAGSPALRQEISYWLDQPWSWAPRLPLDLHGSGATTLASEHEVTVELDAEHTAALLQKVPRAYNSQINDALLSALARAFAGWTGEPALLLDLEGHGREEIFPEADLSRTVGWFTSSFPVLLQLSPGADPGSALKEIKEQLRRVPQGGVGYGVLRYLAADEALANLPRAEVVFNYLGQLDQALSGSSFFSPAPESRGPVQSPRTVRRHLLDWTALVAGGRLRITCRYSDRLHSRATIERLVEATATALRELVEHCRAPEAGGFTPSDFAAARVDQKQLDRFLARIGGK